MTCTRCGTCCRKGGPALHLADLALVQSGAVSWTDLVALRRGELAYDPVLDAVRPLAAEVLKVKGRDAGSWHCRFHDPDAQACELYDDRPAQCRALDCQDTSALEAMYGQDRLDRAALFPPDSALGQLVAEHEAACPVDRARELALAAMNPESPGGRAALLELAEMVDHDMVVRAVVADKLGLTQDHLWAVFGRPLPQVLAAMGLRLENPGLNPARRRKAATFN